MLKTSLTEQLNRVESGCYAHEGNLVAKVQEMADIPLIAYMYEFPHLMNKICRMLGISQAQKQTITFQQTAALIWKLQKSSENSYNNLVAARATVLLESPILAAMQRLKEKAETIVQDYNERSKKDGSDDTK